MQGMCYFWKKHVPARNAPVVVLAGSSGNKRMSLPKIEEPLGFPCEANPYEMNLYMRSRFYRENLDQTGKCHCKVAF